MLTTHHGPLGPNGSIIPMGDTIAKVCQQIIADRPKAFLREARAFAKTQRAGSFERLRELIAQYRTERWARNRHQRTLIVAEILKLKRVRITVEAGLLEAAE